MYTDYWNLIKPPFDNVPDSSMYVDCHESMENVISETIFAIKEGNECFAVIFGDVGLGKTLSLRVIIDSLEPEKYKVALITNPALSFIQLLREIIGQITGKQCEEKKKVDLLEIFNRLLFETNDQGQKIVIVIDESNVLTSANLDDLRLLTNMQDDEHNLFTLILAGQIELAEKLEHPKMANLFQRIGTYGHIEKLPSEEALKTYVETRLRLAGNQRKIFSDDAIPVIWEFSEYGTPRLINKICKLCLKAGETNEFQTISGEVVAQIADRFKKISKPALPKSKAHIRPEIETQEETSSKADTELPKKKPGTPVPRKAVPKVDIPDIRPQMEKASVQPRAAVSEQPPARPVPTPMEEVKPVQPKAIVPEQPPARPVPPPMEEVIPVQLEAIVPEQPPERPVRPPMEEAIPVQTKVLVSEQPPARPVPPPMEKAAVRIEAKAVLPEQPPARPVPPPMEETAVRIEAKAVLPEQPPARPVPPPMEEVIPVQPRALVPEQPPARPVPPPMEEAIPVQSRAVVPEQPPARPVLPPMEEVIPVQTKVLVPEQPPARPVPPPMEEVKPVQPKAIVPEQPPARPVPPPMEEAVQVETKVVPLAKPVVNYVPIQGVPLAKPSVTIPPKREEAKPVEEKQKETEEPLEQAEKEVYEVVLIGQQNVELCIPANVIKQAQLASSESKNKLAGYWSAQIIKGNPHIMKSSLSDPVAIWFEVKNVILKKFNST